MHWLGLFFVVGVAAQLATALDPVCSCTGCMQLALQEFSPSSIQCSAAVNGTCPCTWELLNTQWCAEGQGGSDYSLRVISASGEDIPYTNDCSRCIGGGGTCALSNITQAQHSIPTQDLALAILAVCLEAWHVIVVVWLPREKVVLLISLTPLLCL